MTNLLFEFDKRQAEWIVVAYLANDAAMMEVHKNGLDPHTRTGHLISSVPEEVIRRENKLLGHTTDPGEILRLRQEHAPELLTNSSYFLPRTMSIRQAGKKANHGLNYKMGWYRFSRENELSAPEAKRIVKTYYDVYPGVSRNYHDGIKQQLAKDRTLCDPWGNKQRFLGQWGEELFKLAYSWPPQSTVVTILNEGMKKIYHDDSAALKGVEIMQQVHDSVVLQVPVDNLAWAAEACVLIYEHLTPTLQWQGREFIIWTDLKIGPNLGDMIEVPLEPNREAMYLHLKEATDEMKGVQRDARINIQM